MPAFPQAFLLAKFILRFVEVLSFADATNRFGVDYLRSIEGALNHSFRVIIATLQQTRCNAGYFRRVIIRAMIPFARGLFFAGSNRLRQQISPQRFVTSKEER